MVEEEIKNNGIDTEVMYFYLQTLIRGQTITYDEKSQIISSLHNTRMRDSLTEFLKSINSPR